MAEVEGSYILRDAWSTQARHGSILCADASPNGDSCALGTSGSVCLVSLSPARTLFEAELPQAAHSVSITAQGNVLSGCLDGVVRLWSPEGDELASLHLSDGGVATDDGAEDDRVALTTQGATRVLAAASRHSRCARGG